MRQADWASVERRGGIRFPNAAGNDGAIAI
jgi:hypothetical protein